MLLMILRHGKAEKDSPTGRDVDRPLANRGLRQAEYVGELLSAAKKPLARPSVILASRAERAKHTASIVAEALGMTVTLEDALTLGNSTGVAMRLVRSLVERDQPVLLVGHNPQLEDLVSSLTGTASGMSTGELVAVEVVGGKQPDARGIGRFRLDEDD